MEQPMRGVGLTLLCTICGIAAGVLAMTHAARPEPAKPAATVASPDEPDVLAAMQKLDWLLGTWDGQGMLGTPSGDVTQNGPWKVERAYDGRYLRLEFDAEKEHYRTVWLNVDNLFRFHETGTLDDVGKVLTRVSDLKRPDGTATRVRSVFTKVGVDRVTCEDHRLDENGGVVRKRSDSTSFGPLPNEFAKDVRNCR
jgi:hypothetical protein